MFLGRGYINATEFIAPLSRCVHDSKTAPRGAAFFFGTFKGTDGGFLSDVIYTTNSWFVEKSFMESETGVQHGLTMLNHQL